MYDRLCLGMEEDERAAKLQEAKEKGLPYVIRMKIPHGTTTVRDMIRGQVTFPNKTLDVSRQADTCMRDCGWWRFCGGSVATHEIFFCFSFAIAHLSQT